MGTFLIILIILFVLGPLLMRLLAPWLQRWMAGRMEDAVRRKMGMPSRKEEERMRRESRKEQQSRAGNGGGRHSDPPRGRRRGFRKGPIIPPEYAEDVEFTEVRTFTQTDIRGSRTGDDGSGDDWHESQIEDAEYVEIKDKRK